MRNKKERDEHLERIWYLRESNKDSLEELKDLMGDEYDPDLMNELLSEGFIDLNEEDKRVSLKKEGEEYARKLIRAHRIAERMLYDVLGIKDFEAGACEFEHTITPELVNGICILLGHPKSCPHGLPIPEGECCRKSLTTAQSSVVPLTEIELGRSVRIAYVTNKDDQQLHRMDGLHIRPGAIVRMHQTYPAFVIECEGTNIALDNEVAFNIFVWKDQENKPGKHNAKERCGKKLHKNKGFMRRLRGGLLW